MYMPKVFSHFKEQKITPILFASEWFTALFGYSFELEFTTAIWTVFFHQGKPWLFKVALGILRCLRKKILTLPFEKIILLLKRPPVEAKEVMKHAFRYTTVTQEMADALRDEAKSKTNAEALM